MSPAGPFAAPAVHTAACVVQRSRVHFSPRPTCVPRVLCCWRNRRWWDVTSRLTRTEPHFFEFRCFGFFFFRDGHVNISHIDSPSIGPGNYFKAALRRYGRYWVYSVSLANSSKTDKKKRNLFEGLMKNSLRSLHIFFVVGRSRIKVNGRGLRSAVDLNRPVMMMMLVMTYLS